VEEWKEIKLWKRSGNKILEREIEGVIRELGYC